MTEFKQIIGRGTRIREDYGKRFFTIMDFRNVTRLFFDPDFDGELLQIYTGGIPGDDGSEASSGGGNGGSQDGSDGSDGAGGPDRSPGVTGGTPEPAPLPRSPHAPCGQRARPRARVENDRLTLAVHGRLADSGAPYELAATAAHRDWQTEQLRDVVLEMRAA